MFRSLAVSLSICIALILGTQASGQQFADTIVYGDIITMEPGFPRVEAMAIKGDTIVALGTRDAVRKLAGDETQTVVVPAEQCVIPGLIEGHGHFLGLGASLMMLRLAEAATWDDIVNQVEEAAKVTPPGEWILGRGWHQSKWKDTPQPNVEGYPYGTELDRVAPNNPVLLTHASGHMSLANGYAMQLAGVDEQTQPPDGGEILHAPDGKPIGIFRETSQALISRALARDEAQKTSQQRLDSQLRAIQLAGAECLKNGITSFQDAGTSVQDIRLLRSLAEQGKLPVRLWIMVRDSNDVLQQALPKIKAIGAGDEYFSCRAIKHSIDGALGPHGAWLLAPYNDLASSSGLNTTPLEVIERSAELAIQNDFQLCVHAIGDRANRETLDIFETALGQVPNGNIRRWRVEHAQHLSVDDIPRFASLGVIASMQGVHCTSDAIFVLQRLGNLRAREGAYVWRSLIDSGAIVSNGTDAPVENVNPFPSLAASMFRTLSDGETFFPEQCMTREEALQSYTIHAAYAAFEESRKGSLVAGKLADFVVLDRDILTCEPAEVATTKVLKTFLGGKLVYEQTPEDAMSND
ncbi:MAG: amidohydrolase [Pirellulaceae bacterium]